MRPGQTYEELKKAEAWSCEKGDKVRHAAHGEGKVKHVTSMGQAEVEFSKGIHTVPIKSLNPMEQKRRDFPIGMHKVFAI